MDSFERASREMEKNMVNVDPSCFCWICGADKPLTKHHAIPQCLKPKRNKYAMVCHDCHEKINLFYLKQYGCKYIKIALALRGDEVKK